MLLLRLICCWQAQLMCSRSIQNDILLNVSSAAAAAAAAVPIRVLVTSESTSSNWAARSERVGIKNYKRLLLSSPFFFYFQTSIWKTCWIFVSKETERERESIFQGKCNWISLPMGASAPLVADAVQHQIFMEVFVTSFSVIERLETTARYIQHHHHHHR